MEDALHDAVGSLTPIVEAMGVLIIVIGVGITFLMWLGAELRVRPTSYEGVRLVLARFLALGLEFLLAADLLSTAVSPSWKEVGLLAAIVAIRTAINYFLGKDLANAKAAGTSASPEHRAEAGAEVAPAKA